MLGWSGLYLDMEWKEECVARQTWSRRQGKAWLLAIDGEDEQPSFLFEVLLPSHSIGVEGMEY